MCSSTYKMSISFHFMFLSAYESYLFSSVCITVNFNSFMSYAYTYYQHHREQSLYGLHWQPFMLFYHGFLLVIYLNRHWLVFLTIMCYSFSPRAIYDCDSMLSEVYLPYLLFSLSLMLC